MDKSEDKKPRVLDLGEEDITVKPERGHDEIVKMYNDYRATVIGDKEPTEQQMSILQGIADRLLDKPERSDDLKDVGPLRDGRTGEVAEKK